MPTAILIVASTRAHADTQEILRIQDTVNTLLAQGNLVDVLVPRVSPLLSAGLAPTARVFKVFDLPGCASPPDRPSLRRFVAGLLMYFRAYALASRRDYIVLHGMNDGAIVARALARTLLRRRPYVAEFHTPLSTPGFFRGPRAAVARALERDAFRHAGAVILPDDETFGRFGGGLPRARVTIIPDPHAELVPEAFTFGEFALAIEHVYAYVLRPRAET